FAAIIIPGQSGTYRHLHGRVAGFTYGIGSEVVGADHCGEYLADALPRPAAALVRRRGRSVRSVEPLVVGRGQGLVDLGPAGGAFAGEHRLGHGEDDIPVPVRVG